MSVLKTSTIVLLLSMTGCASQRYLSEEEDAKMKAMCEQPGGCAVLPGTLYRDILKLLGSMQGT